MAEETTPFASPSNIIMHGNIGTVEYGGGDRGMVAMFYNKAIHNPAKSAESGRPVYEDKVYIRIHPPGERLNIVDRPADDSHKRRFPVQWAQFQQNRQQLPEGTPVDLLYPDHPAVPATLRAHNVHTVEQLAELSANAIESVGMGAQRYVNDAKSYLEKANKGVGIAQHRRDLEERDQKISTLERLIQEQSQQIAQMAQNQNTSGIDLLTLQKMISGAMTRPTFPNTQGSIAPAFDAATAQINATHGSAVVPKEPRRQRRRLG